MRVSYKNMRDSIGAAKYSCEYYKYHEYIVAAEITARKYRTCSQG